MCSEKQESESSDGGLRKASLLKSRMAGITFKMCPLSLWLCSRASFLNERKLSTNGQSILAIAAFGERPENRQVIDLRGDTDQDRISHEDSARYGFDLIGSHSHTMTGILDIVRELAERDGRNILTRGCTERAGMIYKRLTVVVRKIH